MTGRNRYSEPSKARLIEEYRAKAQRCRSEANVTRVLERRAELEALARNWDRLADEADRKEPTEQSDTTIAIVFDPKPVEIDGLWSLKFSLADGRKDYVTGFSSESQAETWLKQAAKEWARLRRYSA